jgi:monovalent cation:H+ antiporter, CPA1 family
LLIATFAVAAVLLVLALFVRSHGRLFPAPIPRSWGLVIFWSGLRGALSLALVLALPMEMPAREVLLVSTYAVVLLTLLVQGFSLRFVLARVPSMMPGRPLQVDPSPRQQDAPAAIPPRRTRPDDGREEGDTRPDASEPHLR